MGKTTGFIEFGRETYKTQSVDERLKHYKKFSEPLTEISLAKQGARCMDCGTPLNIINWPAFAFLAIVCASISIRYVLSANFLFCSIGNILSCSH